MTNLQALPMKCESLFIDLYYNVVSFFFIDEAHPYSLLNNIIRLHIYFIKI